MVLYVEIILCFNGNNKEIIQLTLYYDIKLEGELNYFFVKSG